MKRTLFLLLLFVLSLTTCASPNPTNEIFTDSQTDTAPENQNINENILMDGLKVLDESTIITSFIITQNDTIVFEKYYNGSDKTQSTNIQSVTKSVISALIGIAIRESYIKGTDQKLSEFFPADFPREDDALKNDLTLRHLLTMSAGFYWESDEPMYRRDPIGAILSQPLVTEPGKSFHYNSGLPHIISILIAQESGMSTREFAEQYLFDPLDISLTQWKVVNSDHNGCCELWLTSRDLVKIGQLYLHQGEWNGEQIIPKDWVLESTQFHIETDDKKGYGYYWWLTTISGHDIFSALGWGGQFIHVIPDLNLVIVGTKNLSELADSDPYEYEIMEKFFIPSIENNK
jgi:CubicO group peptidase (beta-lactamase class C family)